MAEETLVEVSRWVREAELATVAKIAAQQLGELFADLEPKESDNEKD